MSCTSNPPASASQRPSAFNSIAFAHSLDDEDGPNNDAHQTHNQAQGTHYILFCLWEWGSCFKLWGSIKQSIEVINVVGRSTYDQISGTKLKEQLLIS